MEKVSETSVIVREPDSNPYASKAMDTERIGFSGKRKKTGESLAEQLAGDFFHHKNVIVEEIRKKYPAFPAMWNVYKMFPRAKNGPLYIDEPIRSWEVEECEKKAKLMREAGLRYIYIKPHMQLLEAMEQLNGKVTNGLVDDSRRAVSTTETAERQRERQVKGPETSHRKDRRK